MSIFKKLFGKKEETKAKDELKSLSDKDQELLIEMMNKMSKVYEIETNTPELFKEELYNSLNRYYSSPELKIELNLKDENGVVLEEHEAFNHTFSEWKKIHSVWDRRALFFQQWDEIDFNKLQKWQVIERFIKDRYALKALDYQNSKISEEDFQDIRLIVALSKLYRVLDLIPQATHYAKAAYELRSDLDIVKVEYANVLHLSDSHEDKELSHKLINEVIENKINNSVEKEIALLSYFIFSEDYLDSSIFLINILKEGKCDSETWEKLAGEYYWCPIFRFEHSVFLSQIDENFRALAKLDSLANEFPWFKSGVLANIDAINQLRQQRNDSNFMSAEMNKMEQYVSMWKE